MLELQLGQDAQQGRACPGGGHFPSPILPLQRPCSGLSKGNGALQVLKACRSSEAKGKEEELHLKERRGVVCIKRGQQFQVHCDFT